MGFKTVSNKSARPTDPESLFRDLPITALDIQNLWSHQADILREYNEKFIESNDIAIELPTGTGKTLVGFLIGEFRRRAFDERVLYLCPTKQLAYQVQTQASKYGIKSHVFVGSKHGFSVTDYNEYAASKAIAISTYSGLFNINPKFTDSNVIILDDAHAGENYIASLWSVEINRFDHGELFQKIISLFEKSLSVTLVQTIQEKDVGYTPEDSVDMIPAPALWEHLDSLTSLIEENPNESYSYSWSLIKEHLAACNVFISWHKILIRPWIPPTLNHFPFANSKQRIYMSATLGASGELERITGIQKIDRLPVPAGWDKQGSGRRFFIFPDQSFAQKDYINWVFDRICNFNRTLVLCPNNNIASVIEENIKKMGNSTAILGSSDIENTLEPFSKNDKAALILTNRYDGIDLPDDTCRQLIIIGNPDATNLQEKFIHSRLRITSLLKDRIITRFTQATGRCTRGIRDYSLVILVGDLLHQTCLRKENIEVMHPELQAEIMFGLENSNVDKIDELSELCELFLDQGDEWKDADQEIKDLRHSCNVSTDKRSLTLMNVVKHEVQFQYSLWKGDYHGALSSAQNIIDKLSGDDFKGYRALWHYFAGCIAWQIYLSHPKEGFEKLAKDSLDRSISCINTKSWFSNVILPTEINVQTIDDLTIANIKSAENINKNIIKYGTTGPKFEEKMQYIKKFIYENDANKFEEGLTKLGELLGFVTDHPTNQAAPDSVWQINDSILIIFEAKSDENKDNGISVSTCREADHHYNWAESSISFYDRIDKKYVVVVSPRGKIDEQALPHAKNLYFIDIGRVREIFETISGVYRRLRSQFTTYDEEEIQSKILNELIHRKLDPKSIIIEIENMPLNKLPHKR